MAKEITPKQALFVSHYCSGKGAAESAILAGFAPKSARTRAYDLINGNEFVKQAIREYREKLQVTTGYNQEKAMTELDEGIAFAKQTNNATALARFSELKMKLHGLLDKDRDNGVSSFQINIVGLSDPSARGNGVL